VCIEAGVKEEADNRALCLVIPPLAYEIAKVLILSASAAHRGTFGYAVRYLTCHVWSFSSWSTICSCRLALSYRTYLNTTTGFGPQKNDCVVLAGVGNAISFHPMASRLDMR
jgi:hypothetical protein